MPADDTDKPTDRNRTLRRIPADLYAEVTAIENDAVPRAARKDEALARVYRSRGWARILRAGIDAVKRGEGGEAQRRDADG